jgi:hypothetical protein
MTKPSEPTAPADPPHNPPRKTITKPTTRPWLWLIPTLTFVLGVVLGAAAIAAFDGGTVNGGGRDLTSRPTAPTAPTAAGRTGDRTITIPASCEQGLERARTALSTVGEAVEAARSLNSGRLQEILDRLQDAQHDVERLADQCRAEVSDRN